MKTDESSEDHIKQLIQGAGISLIFGLGSYITMFFIKMVLARSYGPTDFGLFEMANTILSLIIIFATFGLPAGLSRFVPIYKHSHQHEYLRGYLTFSFSLLLILSISCASLLFLSSDYLSNFLGFPDTFSNLLKVVSLAIPLRSISIGLRKVFIAEQRIFFQNLNENVIEKVLFFLSVIYVLWSKLPIIFIGYAFLIAVFLTFLFDLVVFYKIIPPIQKVKPSFYRKDWVLFSLPLVFTGFFAFVIQWSDNLIVGKLLSPAALGVYAIAYALADFIGFLQMPFTGILSAIIGKQYALKKEKKIGNLYTEASSLLLLLSAFCFSLFVVSGKDLLVFFYGESYAPGYLPLYIVAAGLVLYNSVGLNEVILVLYKKTRSILAINVGAAILNIFLNIFFIPVWGLAGAAIASIIAINTKSLAGFFLARRCTQLHFSSRLFTKIFLIALLSIAGGMSVPSLHLAPFTHIIFKSFCTGALYFLLAISTGILKKDTLLSFISQNTKISD